MNSLIYELDFILSTSRSDQQLIYFPCEVRKNTGSWSVTFPKVNTMICFPFPTKSLVGVC